MNFDRKFLVWALLFAIAGISLGIYMAASENHSELVAHAHILMIGFVVSLIYGIIHKLWLAKPNAMLANIQFWLHQASAIGLSAGLVMVFGGMAPAANLMPLLILGSIGVLVGMVMMLYMVLTSQSARA